MFEYPTQHMRPLVFFVVLAVSVLQAVPCGWASAMGLHDEALVEMHLGEAKDETPATLPDPEPEATSNAAGAEWAETNAFLPGSDWTCQPVELRRMGFPEPVLSYCFDPGLAIERPPRA